MLMRTTPRRTQSAKDNLFYNHFFNLSDEKRKKPDILTSFLIYKKLPFIKIKQNRINPFFHLRKNNSTNLLSKQNLIKKKPRKYSYIKRKINKNDKNNNKLPINNINNKRPKEDNQENKFKKRYKNLIKNLSFNGNSKVSFKNLSNEILDDLFKNKPYNSFDKQNIKNFNIFQPKFNRYKYKYILNRFNRVTRNDKNNFLNNKEEKNIKSLSSKDIINKKHLDYDKINKKEIENKILKERTKDNYSEKSNDTPPITSKRQKNKRKNLYCDFNSKNINKRFRTRKSAIINYGFKFHNLKMKLRKQNDLNIKLINNIKKEQSLSKYKLQVGIVKLNKHISTNKKRNKLSKKK